MTTAFDFSATNIDGHSQWLSQYAGKVLQIAQARVDAIKSNFTKLLVGRDGHVIHRYGPTDTPQSFAAGIEAALG